jgi:hypothetical protein
MSSAARPVSMAYVDNPKYFDVPVSDGFRGFVLFKLRVVYRRVPSAAYGSLVPIRTYIGEPAISHTPIRPTRCTGPRASVQVGVSPQRSSVFVLTSPLHPSSLVSFLSYRMGTCPLQHSNLHPLPAMMGMTPQALVPTALPGFLASVIKRLRSSASTTWATERL